MVISPSLLITDDDRDFRETLRDVFRPLGFRTLLAADGEEAVQGGSKNKGHACKPSSVRSFSMIWYKFFGLLVEL